jgi:hypothetical protein
MALEEPIRPLRTAYYLGYWLVEMRSRAEARWYASDVWPGLLVHLMAEIESAINELGHVLPVGQEAAMEHLLSVRESFTAAKQYLDGAWNDEHRIAIARENDDAEPEFIRTLSLAESPFCAPAWTNLESKLVELCEVLPPPILVCFRAGLAVSWLHGPPLTVSTQEGADELGGAEKIHECERRLFAILDQVPSLSGIDMDILRDRFYREVFEKRKYPGRFQYAEWLRVVGCAATGGVIEEYRSKRVS